MGGENDFRAFLDQKLDGRYGSAQAGVIRDRAVLHWDIEINADKNAFALKISSLKR
jgi:hypothetical protein